MNDFEAGIRKVIPAVLIYPKQAGRILMMYRDGRKPEDFHQGKWNGLGGKCERDESPLDAARRELQEESGLGLPLERFRHLGVLQFPNFKPHKKEDWMVFLFVVDVPAGCEPMGTTPEGRLEWIPESELLDLNLWAGDRLFIPAIIDEKPLIATLWYEGEQVKKYQLNALR